MVGASCFVVGGWCCWSLNVVLSMFVVDVCCMFVRCLSFVVWVYVVGRSSLLLFVSIVLRCSVFVVARGSSCVVRSSL